MAAIRENYWTPKLQHIATKIIRKCFGCKRCHTKPFTTQKQGILLLGKTAGARSFQVIGIDFAGPIMYCNKNRGEKGYCTYFFSHAV